MEMIAIDVCAIELRMVTRMVFGINSNVYPNNVAIRKDTFKSDSVRQYEVTLYQDLVFIVLYFLVLFAF